MATIPAPADLVAAPLDDVMAEAAAIRDRTYGNLITWSPKVVIPVTGEAFLDPEPTLAIARRGAEGGAHEALFVLDGDAAALDRVLAACQLILDETGLLPHVTGCALSPDELATVRAVAPVQGMVLRLVGGDPDAQLATLDAAGRLRVPFVVDLLVGSGETRDQRLDALRLVAAAQRRHGHIQQVSVRSPPPGPDNAGVVIETLALARVILPPAISLQAAAPLDDDAGALLNAGIDDWGGDPPAEAELGGFVLAPRLAVLPPYAADPGQWIDPALHFAVLDRSDASGFARDDPGTVLPHRFAARTDPGSGAEVALIGPRSTAWYAGGDSDPPALVPARAARDGAVREILDGVLLGQDTGETELLALFGARGPEVAAVCEVADQLRADAVGDTVTFVRNRNINYTNVCTFRCRFCAFSKGPLSLNLRGRPYLLGMEEIVERVVDAARRGATEVCLQGGIHPDFDGDYYLGVLRAVKAAAPAIHAHGFTALEVWEGSRRLGEPLEDYLRRLAEAGLGSLPGTAAEILDDGIRSVICPDKVTTDEWLEVHRTAHRAGLRSNITIMFGTVEQPVHWVRHILRTRALQRETGGFTEFVPLPFVHMAAPLYLERRARRGPTFREALLMHAVGRIAYAGVLDNIQGSWVKLGLAGLSQVLRAGANDVGGTLMGENISRAAGAGHGQELTEEDFRAVTDGIGRRLEQRTTLYGRVA